MVTHLLHNSHGESISVRGTTWLLPEPERVVG